MLHNIFKRSETQILETTRKNLVKESEYHKRAIERLNAEIAYLQNQLKEHTESKEALDAAISVINLPKTLEIELERELLPLGVA